MMLLALDLKGPTVFSIKRSVCIGLLSGVCIMSILSACKSRRARNRWFYEDILLRAERAIRMEVEH